MRVASISVNINTPDFNYGAILHSWAFQQYVQRLDFVKNMEIIDYTTPYLEKMNRFFPWAEDLKDLLKAHQWRKAYRLLKTWPAYLIRLYKFHQFEKKRLICTKPYTQKKLAKSELPFDTIVCESDVIWNPKLCANEYDPSFFAALPCFKKMNKVAYSPSLGDRILNDTYGQQFKELLKNLDHISCRESYAKTIIENYTTKPVTHVLDPVMLLEADDYKCITASRIIKDDYLLLYLPVNNNPKLREQANLYAQKHQLKILEISTHLKKIKANDVTLTHAGVEEFLSSIKHASCIFTNSFHAICFAIIFQKEFYAFTRNVVGKVRDICQTMNLAERFLEDDHFTEMPPIDFNKVDVLWHKLQAKSQNWLIQALKNNSNVVQ